MTKTLKAGFLHINIVSCLLYHRGLFLSCMYTLFVNCSFETKLPTTIPYCLGASFLTRTFF